MIQLETALSSHKNGIICKYEGRLKIVKNKTIFNVYDKKKYLLNLNQ